MNARRNGGEVNLADRWYDYALNVYSENSYTTALLILRRALLKNPGEIRYLHLKAKILDKMKDFEALEILAETLLSRHREAQEGAQSMETENQPMLLETLLFLAKSQIHLRKEDEAQKTMAAFEDLRGRSYPRGGRITGPLKEIFDSYDALTTSRKEITKEKTRREQEDEVRTVLRLMQDDNAFTVASNDIFILSMNWFRKWKQFNGYTEFAEKEGLATGEDKGEDGKNDFVMEEEVRYLGPVNNDYEKLLTDDEYLVDAEYTFENFVIRQDAEENKDFLLVNKEVKKYLDSKYRMYFIPRKTIELAGGIGRRIQVEVWYKPIRFLMYPPPSFYKQEGIPLDLDLVYISKMTQMNDVREKILTYYKNLLKREDVLSLEGRFLKIDPVALDIMELKKKLTTGLPADLKATLIHPEIVVDEADFGDSDVLILEVKETNNWYFKAKQNGKKGSNKTFTPGDKKIDGGKNGTHNTAVNSEADVKTLVKDFDIDLSVKMTANSRKGLTGLQNLGNTCFMNSAIQSLSNSWELTSYFLENKFLYDTNRSNPLGTRGLLAVCYSELLKELWCGSAPFFSPYDLKKCISKFANQFSGYAQHDSQELLSYLLDGLHEDLNRVIKKEAVPTIEATNNKPDALVSKESWENHCKRNRSIIVDLFHGQFKSTLICPDCSRISITFDPFNMVSVPVATHEYSKFFMYFIFADPTRMPMKIFYNIPNKSTIRDLRQLIAQDLKVAPDSVFFALLKEHRFSESVRETDTAYYLKEHPSILFAYEIYDTSQSLTPDNSILVKFNILQESKAFYETEKLISYSKIFAIPKVTTLKELQLEIYKKMRVALSNYQEKASRQFQIDLKDSTRPRLESEYREMLSVDPADQYYRLYYMNATMLKNVACPLCDKKPCKGCKVSPDDDNKQIINLCENKDGQLNLYLDLKLNKTMKPELASMNKCTDLNSEAGNPTGEYTLEHCLNLFTQTEKLESDNAWYCNKCKAHKEATKKIEIYKAPEYLIIHLKRFKASKMSFTRLYSGAPQKLNSLIVFPMIGLDLTRYILGKGSDEQYIYDLYAVSNHYGSLNGGHYTAYCKNPITERWYDFNDSRVTPANEKDIVSAAAYVLFYKRRLTNDAN